ncbi:ATP-dependent nuclease [Salicibibacter kimchii]|uniref:ATP-dependent endonuclease n=1 Tax=Salicibibacter kimchii TaxID=2099786 RepID=A0A345BWH3_9BACI|nr:AAA family ATPase [Salicibibacter kimchii]AXF55304.1 ATP-dependent endonuclease [Salicibibacter kimchii]
MTIKKIIIENFKGFEGKFLIDFNSGLNVLVGNNEAGKSTILEAIHLALTGFFNGRYIRNELTQYLFNNQVVDKYIYDLEHNNSPVLPYVLIEVYIDGDDYPILEGNGNSEKNKECGVSFKIAFDENYTDEYESLVQKGNIKTIPIEYYEITWCSFARAPITPRSIPIKSAMIDTSNKRNQNGSDLYISQIVRNNLEPEEMVDISQAHRKMRESFMADPSINAINKKISQAPKISDKEVELSVDLVSKNAWENSLMTYVDSVPFHFLGKGEQSTIKTQLALAHNKSKEANVILIEEPENHLSHSKLNQFVENIKRHHKDKQIIISTHNSFVANKLGLNNLILLNDNRTVQLKSLLPDTQNFFEKVSGYDTLRLILCDKAILVEGASDELVVQKAYMLQNDGKLPIEDGVDVISVGTSFLRFLEIAEKINKQVVVVTDSDGDVEAVRDKYSKYLDEDYPNIKICYDHEVDKGDLVINNKPFNYNTLEPKILKNNDLQEINNILNTKDKSEEELHIYMNNHKTDCALKIFNTEEKINFPNYILEAIE